MFEIISYGGGGFLQQVLNGVAMFFGNTSYIYALQMTATLACLGILVNSAFTGKLPDLRWMFGIIMIYIVLLVPKVDVTITDTVERTPGFPGSTPTVRVAGNVPIGLAFTASFTSQMKDYFTRGIETVFSMPAEISYRRGGPLFAQGIMESGLNAKPKDPNLNISLANFWKDCVFFDIALGYYSMTDLSKADDLQTFLANNTASNRMYEHVAANGTKSFQVCSASIGSGPLAVDLAREVQEQNRAVAFINNFATAPSASNTNALITSNAAAMPLALQYLTKMSLTSSQMLAQTTLANSFSNGLVAFSSSAEAQEVMQGYTAAKAEAERSLTFGVMGRVAGRMLPLVNIIAEAMIYAVFPIIGLMLMFPGAGKVLLGYVIAQVWIALWAPLYAVFHFFSMYFTANAGIGASEICDTANVCVPHLNLYTMSSMKEAFANAAAISGYFATLVPMVAYMLVSRSGAMMASTVGRALDGYTQPVSHAATEAAGGNVSGGSVQWQNQQAFQQNTAPSNASGHMVTNDGNVARTDHGYGSVLKQNISSLPASASFTEAAQASTSQAVEHATSRLQSEASNLAQARAAEWRNALSHGEGGSLSLSSREGTQQGAAIREQKAMESVMQKADEYASGEGWSKTATWEFKAGLQGALGIGKGPASAGASLGGAYSGASTDKETAEKVERFLASSAGKYSEGTSRETGYTANSESARTSNSIDSADISSIESRAMRAEHSYQEALQNVEAAKQAAQYVKTHASELSWNESNAIAERVIASGGNFERGLYDISVGHHETQDAQSVTRAIVEYYKGREQVAGMDFGSDHSKIEIDGQQRIGDAFADGSRTVSDTDRVNDRTVGRQVLQAAAASEHEKRSELNMELYKNENDIYDAKKEQHLLGIETQHEVLQKKQEK